VNPHAHTGGAGTAAGALAALAAVTATAGLLAEPAAEPQPVGGRGRR
jgi:hypothetical protein